MCPKSRHNPHSDKNNSLVSSGSGLLYEPRMGHHYSEKKRERTYSTLEGIIRDISELLMRQQQESTRVSQFVMQIKPELHCDGR